jgi:copper oxidase (laccase) domain-containing protein
MDGITGKELAGALTLAASSGLIAKLLVDPVKKVVGAVHSGWRGTYKQIARAAVERMVSEWGSDPADLVATVGPHIRDCCYTVGPEVSDLFPEDCRKTASGGTAFSIEKALLAS